MGKAILDIWFRDEKCRPIYNLEDRERWDWVESIIAWENW
jgi:hypothetical protein